jgi:hypothetical protein
MMDDHPLSPAVVRLYARAMEIEREVEELIEDGDYLSTEELLPWLKRPPKQRAAEEAKAKARIANTNGSSVSWHGCSVSVPPICIRWISSQSASCRSTIRAGGGRCGSRR